MVVSSNGMTESRTYFCGRDDELEALMGHYARSASGKGQLVLVSGDAGIGKTRLADEFAYRAEVAGAKVVIGGCLPHALPLLPFKEIMTGLGMDLTRDPVWAGDNTSEVATIGEEWVTRYSFAVLDALKEAGKGQPLVLGLENLHWADSASLEILAFVASNLARMKVLILATYRTGEAQFDLGPLLRMLETVRAMKSEGSIHELPLVPLCVADLQPALEGYMGGSIDHELLNRIAEESEGNPLFALEIMKLLIVRGEVFRRGGLWMVADTRDLGLPSTVRGIISDRLGHLTAEERRVLECAAVLGPRFKSDRLGQLADLDQNRLSDQLVRHQEVNGLIEVDGAGFRFTHDKIRAVVYDAIPDHIRQQLHRKAAAIIETMPHDEASVVDLARHYVSAGMTKEAIDYSLAAGKLYLSRDAFVEAEPLLEKVVEWTGTKGTSDHHWGIATECLADVRRCQSRMEDASGLFSKLLEIEQDPTTRARLLRKKAACWVAEKLGKGDNSEAKSLLDQALSLEDADRKEIAQALIAKGEIQANDGTLAVAWETSVMAERICREIGDDYSIMKALDLSVYINLSTGDVRAAIGPAKEGVALACKWGSPRDRLSSYSSMAQVMMHIGDWNESIAWYRKCVAIAERFRDYSSLAYTQLSMANVCLYSREFKKVFEDATKCYGNASKIGSEFLMSRSMAIMALADVHLGKLDKAMEEAREALAHDANMNWRGPPRCGVLNLMRAEIACAEGEWEVAEPLYRQSLAEWQDNAYSAQHKAFELREFGEMLLKRGQEAEGVRNLEEAVRLYDKLGDESDLAVAREMIGPR